MLSLRDREWKEFRVGDIFEQERGKEPQPKSFKPGNTRIISETANNNGLVGYADPKKIIKGNCISVSVNNATVVFYQPFDFCAQVNILVLRNNNINDKQGLFIANIIREANSKYDYNIKQSRDRLNDTILSLPITSAGQPDYDFMEQYIREREPDYSWATRCVKPDDSISLQDRQWKEFNLGDLFKVEQGKGKIDKDTLSSNNTGYRIATASTTSNGIIWSNAEQNANHGNT